MAKVIDKKNKTCLVSNNLAEVSYWVFEKKKKKKKIYSLFKSTVVYLLLSVSTDRAEQTV